MSDPKPDRLSALIQRFHIAARVSDVTTREGQERDFSSNFFVIADEPVTFGAATNELPGEIRNAIVFFAHGIPNGISLPADNDAKYISAVVDTGGDLNPISLALADVIVVSLEDSPALSSVANILFDEAFSPRCGGQTVIDRLCEIVVIRLLRHLIEAGTAEMGLVGGLAHPNLSMAIVAIHENPEKNWHLESLAEIAGMSRTSFANSFRDVMGVTPGDYLSGWRLAITRLALAKGEPLKSVVGKVGFSSSAALSRAYKRRYGVSPKQGLPA